MSLSRHINTLLMLTMLGGGLASGDDQPSAAAKTRSLGETEVRDMITAALQREHARERGQIEIRLGRPWTPVKVPDVALDLVVQDMPVSGISPNFIVRFELRAGQQVLGNWQMPVRAWLWRDVLVAGSPLRRGQRLSDADLVTERRDLLTLRDVFQPGNADRGAFELTESVGTGMALSARSVGLRPVVRRGQSAEARVQDGAMAITMKVEVIEDGQPGQTIRVRNPKSLREFRAKVLDEQTVLVVL